MQSCMVFKVTKLLRKERPIWTHEMWLIDFIQLLKAFSGRKMIYRGYWGWKIFFSEIWVKGLTLSCGNGKSKGVWGGGGVTVGIPSVVGVWIFSGNTHFE